MSYIQIPSHNWPPAFAELDAWGKRWRSVMGPFHYTIAQRKYMSFAEGPEWKFKLIRNGLGQREILLESESLDETIGFLKLLIDAEEYKRKLK